MFCHSVHKSQVDTPYLFLQDVTSADISEFLAIVGHFFGIMIFPTQQESGKEGEGAHAQKLEPDFAHNIKAWFDIMSEPKDMGLWNVSLL